MASWLDILASPNNVQGGRFNPFALVRGFTQPGREELDLQRQLMMSQGQAGVAQAGLQKANAQGGLDFRQNFKDTGKYDPNIQMVVNSPEALDASGQLYQNRATQSNIDVNQAQLPLIQQQVAGATRDNTRNELLDKYLESTIGLGSPGVFDAMRQAELDRSGIAAQGAQTAAVQQNTQQQGQRFAAEAPHFADMAKVSLENQRSEGRNRDIQGFSNLLSSSFFAPDPQRAMQAGASSGNPVAQAYNNQPQKPSPAAAIDQQMRQFKGGNQPAATKPGVAPYTPTGTPSRGASLSQPPSQPVQPPTVQQPNPQASFGQRFAEDFNRLTGGIFQQSPQENPQGQFLAPVSQSPQAKAQQAEALRMALQQQMAELLGTNTNPIGRGNSASNAANLEQIRQMILQLQQQGR